MLTPEIIVHENEKLNPSTKLPIIIIISLLSLSPEALIIGSILRYLLFIVRLDKDILYKSYVYYIFKIYTRVYGYTYIYTWKFVENLGIECIFVCVCVGTKQMTRCRRVYSLFL